MDTEKKTQQEVSAVIPAAQEEKEQVCTEKALKKLAKKLKNRQDRDEKIFMDMLRTTSRNHYLMNQMMDRKSRNMISVNTVVLSLIIGGLVSAYAFERVHYYSLITFSVFSIISLVLAILAMSPEDTHGKLTKEDVRRKEGNPLFFGNFKNLSEIEYENAMVEMAHDRDFVYRSLIQDIYYLGQVLEKKRLQLKLSLYFFTIGLALTIVLAFIFSMSHA
ncbi:MAG: DUF1422 family protein [Bacteroidetes bacterium]|nr:MAG: DUF1422 family protein [Bacteroidota bacterium]